MGAVELMRQVIMEPGRQVTLIATGPLTNVAALMLAHPAGVRHRLRQRQGTRAVMNAPLITRDPRSSNSL
ncbi:MAG TPA: hypothetical protein VFQ68_30115 [Streptosporangiaceae bacterium]|nr:hypothetical protein [Streptosporangiaceae bacterium]